MHLPIKQRKSQSILSRKTNKECFCPHKFNGIRSWAEMGGGGGIAWRVNEKRWEELRTTITSRGKLLLCAWSKSIPRTHTHNIHCIQYVWYWSFFSAFVRSNFPFDAGTVAFFGFPVPKKAINCITNDNNLKHHVNVYFCAFKLLFFILKNIKLIFFKYF
jgi:hypothetical protein